MDEPFAEIVPNTPHGYELAKLIETQSGDWVPTADLPTESRAVQRDSN